MVFCDDALIITPFVAGPAAEAARTLLPVIVLPSLPRARIRPMPFDGVSAIRHRSIRLASVLER